MDSAPFLLGVWEKPEGPDGAKWEVPKDVVRGVVDNAFARLDVIAFFSYVASEQGEFRLVFESDLTNEPAVRERIDRVTKECSDLIAHVIHDDTGLPDEASQLLAVGLVGMGQVSARFWLQDRLRGGDTIEQGAAASLVAGLAWRGIRGYPRTDDNA